MNWIVNDESYNGSISVGDTLEVNGKVYAVLGINEDGVVVKELEVKRPIELPPLLPLAVPKLF